MLKRLVVFLVVVAAACAAAPAAAPPQVQIAPGVTVSGVSVGGLTAEPARTRLREAFAQPLPLRLGSWRWRLPVTRLDASANVDAAVTVALRTPPWAGTRLPVSVRPSEVRGYVAGLARRFARRPRNARLLGLKGLRPVFREARWGRELVRGRATAALLHALQSADRRALELPVRRIAPRVTLRSLGPVIVIRRESKGLYLYERGRLVRRFPVATGQAVYPTPLGEFRIATRQRDPWWYPPPSDWARGLSPVPPGPGNPLGTRWMGLNGGLVGIHGTPNAASIGYSASHGCIRMYIDDASWLFERVRVGTPVFIVSA